MSLLLIGVDLPMWNPRTINIYRDGTWVDAYSTEDGKAINIRDKVGEPTKAKKLITKKEKTKSMDTTALNLVEDYIVEHLDKSEEVPEFEVYTVWKAKVLQNWKYLIASTLPDGMYYELTYNGDKEEWYLDAYKKFENRCIKG